MAALPRDKRKKDNTTKEADGRPLVQDELRKIHSYWRAANYLSVGQIYLYDNPLLKEVFRLSRIWKIAPFGLV